MTLVSLVLPYVLCGFVLVESKGRLSWLKTFCAAQKYAIAAFEMGAHKTSLVVTHNWTPDAAYIIFHFQRRDGREHVERGYRFYWHLMIYFLWCS